MAKTTLQTLPPEIRSQIWTYLIAQPTLIYPCACALQNAQCHSHRLDRCCHNSSTYTHCDNRILRTSRQIHDEILPLVHYTSLQRIFVLCNNLCLDNFFTDLRTQDWKWVKHLQVDLFVGWGKDCQDDWFLCQMRSWAYRYVMGTFGKFDGALKVGRVVTGEEAVEDREGRRTLRVDVYLE